ncbi:ketoacyl-ACP synthase III family protein [Streptomyces sp. NPDC001165]|uniref:ketoacyl-ACP synthase III family protein n=1 Tax=Streptomyces sp. NPDC001165 TaxID=3364546 RepID=UPI00368A4E3D
MRTADRITIAAAAAWLPERRLTPESAGADSEDVGYEALVVAEDPSPPQMAVRAAEVALEQVSWTGKDIDLLLHAWSYYQGHDFWSPAHYVAEQTGARGALPIGIQQMCNGGAVALQTAAAHLLAAGEVSRALITTADKFCTPGFDRWHGDIGVAYGDGATAVLLSAVDADAASDSTHLLSVSTVSSPELEGMHRGHDPFAPAPRWHSAQVTPRRTKKAYLRAYGDVGYRKAEREALTSVVMSALEEAELEAKNPKLRAVVLPRLHSRLLATEYIPLLSGLTVARPVDFGSTTGHLGAGDLAAGLASLKEQKVLGEGEYALLLSTGAGFSWSCAVVRQGQVQGHA